jgi:hypothetical protein
METILESQRFGPLQIRVAILCALAQAFDGYDITSIGMAAPALSHAWVFRPRRSPTRLSCRASASWSARLPPARLAIG